MCGIVGYAGDRQASPILIDGLERLAYRGYDSSGMAVLGSDRKIDVRKTKGRLDNLKAALGQKPLEGCIGIGHTRWATHGEPSDLNAHPHTDVKGGIAVVHNGIIENHKALRSYLSECGAVFVSETDTEVIAHLLHHLYRGDMQKTLAQAMRMLEGSYALGVICDQEPKKLFCARNDSPLVLGFIDGAGYVASDIPAVLPYTRDVVFLEDKEIGIVTTQGMYIYDEYGRCVSREPFHVDWDASSAEKGGYAHYMLKEIHEQPEAIRNTLRPRSKAGRYDWLPINKEEANKLQKITLIGCGTAYHAAVYGKYVLEKLVRLPVEAEVASEYRYRDPVVCQQELVVVISQSGETADTLAAMREAKKRRAHVMAICNVVGSSVAREAGEANTLYTYAGPEIAVASTKAYVTQGELILLVGLALADIRKTKSKEEIQTIFTALHQLPQKMSLILEDKEQIQRMTSRLSQKKHAFFIGRGLDYVVAMEAALKLKEISYVFAQAYAAGELKHGPIALIQEGRLVIGSVTQAELVEKSISNLQEAATRGAKIICFCSANLSGKIDALAEETIVIPDTHPLLTPLLAAVPLQLLAYYMAVNRGCDVDKPRNLAKSVTVE